MAACASAVCVLPAVAPGPFCAFHGAPALRVVCAWCSREMRAGLEPVSHGICRSCAADADPLEAVAAADRRDRIAALWRRIARPVDPALLAWADGLEARA